jgi:hypothetical protein
MENVYNNPALCEICIEQDSHWSVLCLTRHCSASMRNGADFALGERDSFGTRSVLYSALSVTPLRFCLTRSGYEFAYWH